MKFLVPVASVCLPLTASGTEAHSLAFNWNIVLCARGAERTASLGQTGRD